MGSTHNAWSRLGRLGFASLIAAAAGTATAQDAQPDGPAVAVYKVDLHPVNNSGVIGVATLVQSADGNQLTVIVGAQNLESGQMHPQHIHGLADGGASSCPTLAADMDGDNLITFEESEPVAGPPLLPLEPFPSSDDGTMTFGQTFETAGLGLEPLTDRVVEIHGMTVPGQEYVESTPVACGQIVPALPQPAGQPADSGGGGADGAGADDMGDTSTGDTGAGGTGSGDTGAGGTGSGDTGTGDTGSGDTGTGDTGSGDTGSGDTGTGDTGTGDAGTGDPGSDDSAVGDY